MRQTVHLFLLIAGLVLAGFQTSSAQGVGVGTTTPDASAALDVAASNRGALLPRLTQAQRLAIANPAAALLVYQTDGSGAAGPGFWYNRGTSGAPNWVRLTDGSSLSYDPTSGLQVGPGPAVPGGGTVGPSDNENINITPFYSVGAGTEDQRMHYILRAADLTAAGLSPGVPLTSLALNVTAKLSSGPFPGFTIRLANTANTTAGAAFLTSTTVFSGNVTTVAGWNTFTFTTPFTWTGQSLYVETCFDAPSPLGVDLVAGGGVAYQATAYVNLTGGGCTAANAVYGVDELPALRFNQSSGGYVLPAAGGQPGQVLTQQAGGTVAFQDPQWTQNGQSLYNTRLDSRVGIGTMFPAAALHVQAPDSDAVLRLQSTGAFGSAGIEFWSDPAYSNALWRPAAIRSTDDLPQGTFTGGLAFYTNGTSGAERTRLREGMRLYQGRLGIGVKQPQARLEVSDSTANRNLGVFRSNGGYGQLLVGNGTTTVDLGAATGVGYTGTNSAGDFALRTGGTERLRLKNNTGFMGLGTISPLFKLTVQADGSPGNLEDDLGIISYGTSAAPAMYMMRARGSAGTPAAAQAGDQMGVLGLGTSLTTASSISLFTLSGLEASYRGNGSTPLSDLELFTSGQTRLTVTPTGDVGIGTTAPATRLDVSGETRTTAVRTPTTGANNMLATAYGQLGGNGAVVLSGSGNYTFSHPSLGVYVLTFPASSGLNTHDFDFSTIVVTPWGNSPSVATFTGGTGTITVRLFSLGGALVDGFFGISVFK